MKSKSYRLIIHVISRLLFFILTVWIGLTLAFLVSRASPVDPSTVLISRLVAMGGHLRPEEILAMKQQILELYGLDKPPYLQYLSFIKGVITGNLGPSFSFFPTPVIELIYNSLSWTVLLLGFSTILSWVIGNIVGVLAAVFSRSRVSKALEWISMSLYPVPYVIFALLLFLFFSLVIPLARGVGGAGMAIPSLSLTYMAEVIRRLSIPSLSIIALSASSWLLSMKALALSVKREDFVNYAIIRGLGRKTITKYVMRNSLLPQITSLALSLGYIFNGSLVTEYIFAYPGLGRLLYNAIVGADYNLMLGILSYSIIGVASAAFILDLIYPLIDPRIRYGG
ncbi:MAG: ABC transporter permease [Candidatus Bathyarchaeia archaeon]